MAYEIDFINVGTDTKSADAIAMRFWDSTTEADPFVVVIDAGYTADGAKVAQYVKDNYNTEVINLLVSSHPDADHSGGLPTLVDTLQVDELWMHLPWEHSSEIRKMFHDGRMTDESLSDHLKKGLQDVHDLYVASLNKEISVFEPFSDVEHGFQGIHILSPKRSSYQALLPQFRKSPRAGETLALFEAFRKAASGALQFFRDLWTDEKLTDPPDDATSAENNSSTVLLFQHHEDLFLFTSDAGVPALREACDRASELGFDLQKATLIQIPHHGSRRNVGPTLLNSMIGNIVEQGTPAKMTAVVSAAPNGGPKHPSKRVVNGFTRRGCRVVGGNGQHFYKRSLDLPLRDGWQAAEIRPFEEEFEE